MSLWRKRNVKHFEQKHDNLLNPLDRLHEENVRLDLYKGVYDLSIKSDDLSIKQSKGIEMSIEAMKQALEALEYVKQTYDEQGLVSLGTNTAIIDLRQAIAEAEKQEPVGVVDSTISGHIDWLCTFFPKQGTKLYTTPQQRTWVGLTDEEMMDAIYVDDTPMERGRRVEAKLKEKNT